MARPHIEFIHSRYLPWTDDQLPRFRPGVEAKRLSHDPDTGACSLLLRYPPGWRYDPPHALSTPEELFVLEGELTLGERRFSRHAYGYLPEGTVTSEAHSPTGATALAFYDGEPQVRPEDPAPPGPADEDAIVIDCFARPWDILNMDPGVRYLNMGRKNLRLAPDDAGRTYLLAGFPQARPPANDQPLERHPYVEEAFMVSGDMALTCGVMHAGAYFWRPPQLWHGGMYSVNGFLMLIRTPGSNQAINEWSEKRVPVAATPDYRPVLPEEFQTYARVPEPGDAVY